MDKSKVVFDLGEPLIGETPEDFQDLEGCFMTQAIVTQVTIAVAVATRGSPRSPHHQSEDTPVSP